MTTDDLSCHPRAPFRHTRRSITRPPLLSLLHGAYPRLCAFGAWRRSA